MLSEEESQGEVGIPLHRWGFHPYYEETGKIDG